MANRKARLQGRRNSARHVFETQGRFQFSAEFYEFVKFLVEEMPSSNTQVIWSLCQLGETHPLTSLAILLTSERTNALIKNLNHKFSISRIDLSRRRFETLWWKFRDNFCTYKRFEERPEGSASFRDIRRGLRFEGQQFKNGFMADLGTTQAQSARHLLGTANVLCNNMFLSFQNQYQASQINEATFKDLLAIHLIGRLVIFLRAFSENLASDSAGQASPAAIAQSTNLDVDLDQNLVHAVSQRSIELLTLKHRSNLKSAATIAHVLSLALSTKEIDQVVGILNSYANPNVQLRTVEREKNPLPAVPTV